MDPKGCPRSGWTGCVMFRGGGVDGCDESWGCGVGRVPVLGVIRPRACAGRCSSMCWEVVCACVQGCSSLSGGCDASTGWGGVVLALREVIRTWHVVKEHPGALSWFVVCDVVGRGRNRAPRVDGVRGGWLVLGMRRRA